MTIPDIEACTVNGIVQNGMDCVTTLSGTTRAMDFPQMVAFLEPQPEMVDPADPTKKIPERGGAVCLSDQGFAALKVALLQACEKLGRACNKEAKEQIQQVSDRMEGLRKRTLAKAKKPR